MESDYIKREDAINDIQEWATDLAHPEFIVKEDAVCVLKKLPAADVEPVRPHGKPKVVKRKRWFEDYTPNTDRTYDMKKVLVEYEEDFCPFCGKALGDFNSYCGNCGAKMDGDTE